MKPEKIKMDYIYGPPSQKAKSEPEYLQYSEEDKSYSEDKKADQSPLSDPILNMSNDGDIENEMVAKDIKEHENINASVPIIIPDVSFSNDDHLLGIDKFYGLVYTGDNYIEFE